MQVVRKGYAHIAQLVEHVLGKDEVIGSIPIVGSPFHRFCKKQKEIDLL